VTLGSTSWDREYVYHGVSDKFWKVIRSRGARGDFPLDFLAQATIGDIEVATSLQVDPERRGHSEIPSKAQCRVRRDRTAPAHNVVGP